MTLRPADAQEPLPRVSAPRVEEDSRATDPVRVMHLQRKPGSTSFSVERLFADVRAAMPSDIAVTLQVNHHMSRGILPRLADAWRARRGRAQIKHVLGDVHYLAWLLPRRGTVLTVLDCVNLDRLSGLRRWLFWLLWLWWPLQRAEQVTVISEYSKATVLRAVRYPGECIHVIPPPLSPEFTRAAPPAWTGTRRLLQVGTVANKNLDRVIEAIAGLDIVLVVVGILAPHHKLRLQTLGIPCENREMLDLAALVDEYVRADVLLFASTYEGFGLPIIEAQAVGRPVVTSKICAMPEAAGGAACMVDPFDIRDIRAGICRVLDDPGYAAGLVEAGFANAARYRPGCIAELYAGIYRALAAPGTRP